MLAFLAFIAIILADQAMKYWTVQNLTLHAVGPELIPNILGLYRTTNTGGGWSILEGNVLFLIVFPVCVCAFMAWLLISKKTRHPMLKWSLIMILGGAVGNLIDRIFNDMHVIDMFNFLFINFPIFNIADIFISVGAVLLCVYYLFIDKDEKSGGDKENSDS